MMQHFLNQMSRDIHAHCVEVGWWDDWLPDKVGRHETAMALTFSELMEGLEGDRKQLMDNHLPAYPMFHVEVADALIRLLDHAGAYELKFRADDLNYVDHVVQFLDSMTVPEQLMYIMRSITRQSEPTEEVYAGIYGVLGICAKHDIRIIEIATQKFEYNKHRADHKKENRAKEGGKDY